MHTFYICIILPDIPETAFPHKCLYTAFLNTADGPGCFVFLWSWEFAGTKQPGNAYHFLPYFRQLSVLSKANLREKSTCCLPAQGERTPYHNTATPERALAERTEVCSISTTEGSISCQGYLHSTAPVPSIKESPFPSNIPPGDHEQLGFAKVLKWEKESKLNLWAMLRKGGQRLAQNSL